MQISETDPSEYNTDDTSKPVEESTTKAPEETQDVKPTPTITRRKAPLVARPAKRIKTSTPGTAEIVKAKMDGSSSGDLVQFKMEPYEISDQTQEQELSAEAEETLGNEGNDTTRQDETEDYSLIEGMDDEPQAGTSGDGATEGQGM